jgi:hypothetical protein
MPTWHTVTLTSSILLLTLLLLFKDTTKALQSVRRLAETKRGLAFHSVWFRHSCCDSVGSYKRIGALHYITHWVSELTAQLLPRQLQQLPASCRTFLESTGESHWSESDAPQSLAQTAA